MDLFTILLLVALVVIAVYAMQIYNNLVRLKHDVSRAWSNVDIALKQRHDELPKLVEVCRQYMGYEQETLQAVVRARTAVAEAGRRGDVGALGNAESQMRAGLGKLFALAENYPLLKADVSFRHLAERVSQLEETIADRRELYNESVNLNNVRIEQLPDVLVARTMGARPFDLLKFPAARADVDLKTLFR